MKKVLAIFITFLTTCLLAALFPYPFFSQYTNITQKEAYYINNFRETEILQKGQAEQKIVDIDFSQINAILPISSKFEIVDMQTEKKFFATRTGGENHFDIEPNDDENSKKVFQIAHQIWKSKNKDFVESDKNSQSLSFEKKTKSDERIWNWSRSPVLVKINNCSYIPASIAYYPHGYSSIKNSFNGHLCLHFNNSKMDGTNKIDKSHQTNVLYAKKHAKEFLDKLED